MLHAVIPKYDTMMHALLRVAYKLASPACEAVDLTEVMEKIRSSLSALSGSVEGDQLDWSEAFLFIVLSILKSGAAVDKVLKLLNCCALNLVFEKTNLCYALLLPCYM